MTDPGEMSNTDINLDRVHCACSDGEHLLHNLDVQHIIMVRTRTGYQVSVGGCLGEKSHVGDI